MHIIFFLIIVLPYLLFTGAIFIAYRVKRNRFTGTLLVLLVCLPFFLITLGWLSSPTNPSKSDILGHYVIDRSKWPGENSEWQHEIYTLEITEIHAILRDARTETVWKYQIKWSEVYDHYWSFATDSKRHHMLNNGPILYRERFGHYCVFDSSLYNNVFFKKK